MSNHDIKILNSITSTLIDSCSGYQTCCDLADDTTHLKSEFARRHTERTALVAEFQTQVRALGGAAEDSGSLTGAVHRGFARFNALFQDDQKAAISALDDGEEFLAEKIEDRLEDENLEPKTLTLLQRAHASALSGERLADALDD